MIKALKYEIENALPELKGEIYATHAPVDKKKPFLVYYRYGEEKIKTLDGYLESPETSFMFSIMAAGYDNMNILKEKVKDLLESMMGKSIGKDGDVFIEDLTINAVEETYENELMLQRGIIDFTVYH